jgi:O-antigen/teichoic acid export membrane protein
LVLNLMLIPRFGLDGALWATLASYALGLLASFGLGRRALALPIPWQSLARSSLATAAMAVVVLGVPAWGGFWELAAKASAGAAVYGLVAFSLDVCGVRSRGLRKIRDLQVKEA